MYKVIVWKRFHREKSEIEIGSYATTDILRFVLAERKVFLMELNSLVSIYFPNEINESDRYSLAGNALHPFVMR